MRMRTRWSLSVGKRKVRQRTDALNQNSHSPSCRTKKRQFQEAHRHMDKADECNSGGPEVAISYRTRKLVPGNGEISAVDAPYKHEAKHADRRLTLHVRTLFRNNKSFSPE